MALLKWYPTTNTDVLKVALCRSAMNFNRDEMHPKE